MANIIIPEVEEIIDKEFRVLDKGFVRLVQYMGSDESIVQAARVSYGKGTKTPSDDRGLIRYLMRHSHTTPLEMVELKFHAKMPIFVAREWIRHRTANVNEYSLRYSEPEGDYYIPEVGTIGFQDKTNKQGRINEGVPEGLAIGLRAELENFSKEALRKYKNYNEKGIAREICRMFLPVNTYTQWYWKIDLHNLFHFLKLRMDKRAQYEIREYANVMAKITEKVVPMAYEAFEDYKLNSMNLSKLELKALNAIIEEGINIDEVYEQYGFKKGRELNELKDKLEVILKKENVSG